MSQTTLTSFFNSRKRPASDDIVSSKSKLPHIDRASDIIIKSSLKIKTSLLKKCETLDKSVKQAAVVPDGIKSEDLKKTTRIPTNPTNAVQQAVSQSTSKNLPETVNVAAFSKKKINASNTPKSTEVSKPACLNAARKELSLGDIRKKLAGSSRLAEIKATAERLSQGIRELKAASDGRNLKEFKSIDVEVPASPNKKSLIQNELNTPKKEAAPILQQRPLISPRKVVVSPIKSPSKVPAYIRHASLASSATSLPLPHQYRFLAELFRSMETVVALLYNRNEKITFNKLKPSVQEMLKRNFTEKHLAQIKHLVPDFYNFEVLKVKNFATSSQKETFELIISPNFPTDIKIMNPNVLLERRRFFYDTLLQLAKKHHALYLLNLHPPMVIPDDKLTRWHPEFEIEKVPEVDCAKLPEMPNADKYSNAQDVLAKARELFKCNTKMEKALEKLAQAKARGLTDAEKAATGLTESRSIDSSTSTQSNQPQPSTSTVTIINPALRNLPAALLEKVKAKQAAKALEAMTRPPQHVEKYLIYSRLPDLARTLRNIYVTERKNVLALNIVLSKLDSSFKANVSASDLQRDIKTLAEVAPELIKLHDIRNTSYLKLDKNADLKKVTTKLEALAQKYKSD